MKKGNAVLNEPREYIVRAVNASTVLLKKEVLLVER